MPQQDNLATLVISSTRVTVAMPPRPQDREIFLQVLIWEN